MHHMTSHLCKIRNFMVSPSGIQPFDKDINIWETRLLDDSVKMTRLLPFLEGPALLAVQRYEPMSGGLSKALKGLSPCR